MHRILLAATLLFSAPAFAQSSDTNFNTTAPHAVIIDYDTGTVLFEKNAREPIAPASMTKIMTAQLVFEALDAGEVQEDTIFRTSEYAWRTGGAASGSSTMFLPLDSEASVIDLLRGVIVQSGNDASIVLAEGLAGSESAFADRMTERAQELGMSTAQFRNSTGWPDPDHVVSMLDLARLADHQIREHPEYYEIYAEPNFTWNDITQGNRNPLLGRMDGADGLKTGHTEDSGYGLVASAKRGDERRIVVVNGLESVGARARESERLMRAAFDQFKVYQLFAEGDTVGDVPVYMGTADTVAVTVTEDIKSGLFRGDRKGLASRIEYTVVPAPVAVGDEVATLIVTEPGRPDRRVPLVAAEAVEQRGLLGRAFGALASKIRGAAS